MFLDHFKAQGITATYTNALETDYPAIQGIMSAMLAEKKRHVFFLGTEVMYRKMICAAMAAGQIPGMTWIALGIKTRGWWTKDDAELLQLDATCTGAAITDFYQDAIDIAGLGEPFEDNQKNVSLDCFDTF